MDSIIVFFGSASFGEVEQAAATYGFRDGTVSVGREHFYLWRYSNEEMQTENEAHEIEALRRALGSEVKSAFQVACRHGESAKLAIQVISLLMSKFKPSALYDDFGNLWLPEQVEACSASGRSEGIYALRTDA